MQRLFQSWAALASHMIGDYFDHAKPILDQDYKGLPPLVRFVVAQLCIDCHLSSESVLLLIGQEKEWDADLIGRAVMEGSLKLAYMLQGSDEEMARKAKEYWEILPLFSSIRRSKNAKTILSLLENPEALEWRPFQQLLMDEKEVEKIRKTYSQHDRQSLEERWSFSGICKYFAHSSDPTLRNLVGLSHGYAISSHLLHKDADGIASVWERSRREPKRQASIKKAHAARIVSDICTFAGLRLHQLLLASKEPTNHVREISKPYLSLLSELQQANKDFTQTEYKD